jgi:dephospho-CoA kinase
MIIGITGAICSGKRTFAEFLAKKYGFDLIDMLELFRKELRRQGVVIVTESSPLKQTSRRRDSDEEQRENAEEEKEINTV